MAKKLVAIVLVVVAIMMILTACSAAVATRPAPVEGAATYTVEGECSAVVDGDKIVVTGSSDIAVGTKGTLSVYSVVGKELAIQNIVQEKING